MLEDNDEIIQRPVAKKSPPTERGSKRRISILFSQKLRRECRLVGGEEITFAIGAVKFDPVLMAAEKIYTHRVAPWAAACDPALVPASSRQNVLAACRTI